MMEQFKINEIIYGYIADAVSCTVEQLQQEGTFFVMNEKRTKEYIKVLSIKDTNIISLSEDKYEIGKSLLTGKNRDELYESSLIFGQTIHYVPDVKNMQMKPFPTEYKFTMYENHELVNLKGIKGFDNSYISSISPSEKSSDLYTISFSNFNCDISKPSNPVNSISSNPLTSKSSNNASNLIKSHSPEILFKAKFNAFS